MIKIGKILFEIFEKMLGGGLTFWLSVITFAEDCVHSENNDLRANDKIIKPFS